jgi:biofilm PGA synthesis N-glycosyltransferase PgaC
MTFFAIALLLSWVAFLFWIDAGVQVRATVSDADDSSSAADITVLIAFRNEEKSLPACLKALNDSSWARPVSVILIDDHSTDRSVEVVHEVSASLDQLNVRVLESKGHGKKAALRTGLTSDFAEYIYFTDADCVVRNGTMSALVHTALQTNVFAVFGPVLYQGEALWNQTLTYENLNTQCVTEALLHRRQPVMVNGANMLMHKSLVGRYTAQLENEYASGDDVFFAQTLAKDEYGGVYSLEGAVTTTPPTTWKELIHQRVRWASKYGGYQHPVARILPPFVFLVNLGWIAIVLSGMLQAHGAIVFLILYLVKCAIELTFQRTWFSKYGRVPPMYVGLLVAIVFPFYYVGIGLSSLIGTKFKWKDRVLKQ